MVNENLNITEAEQEKIYELACKERIRAFYAGTVEIHLDAKNKFIRHMQDWTSLEELRIIGDTCINKIEPPKRFTVSFEPEYPCEGCDSAIPKSFLIEGKFCPSCGSHVGDDPIKWL
jgi:hypothetical protein